MACRQMMCQRMNCHNIMHNVPVNWVNEQMNYAQLTDFHQDGIPELVFGKSLEGEDVFGSSTINKGAFSYEGNLFRDVSLNKMSSGRQTRAL